MGYFLKVVNAEMIKQHKNYFYNKTIYISLFLWPILVFISTYYGYKPFDIMGISQYVPYLNTNNIMLFVIIGYMCMSFFRSLVQSAWRFSTERIYGTLELIYLTPANRLAIVMGNAVSSVFESVWMFVIFSGAIIFIKGKYFSVNLSMELFSGVKVPIAIFPLWPKAISYIFPLTYTAEILRRALLNSQRIYQLRSYIFIRKMCLRSFLYFDHIQYLQTHYQTRIFQYHSQQQYENLIAPLLLRDQLFLAPQFSPQH